MTPIACHRGLVIVGDMRRVDAAAPKAPSLSPGRSPILSPRHPDVSLIFAGLKSRWMMPCSCAASSASTICRAIGSASSRGIGPRAMRSASVWPLDQLHDERAGPPLVLETIDRGNVRMVQRGEHFASRLKRARRSGSSANVSGRTLSATSRFSLVSRGAIHLAHAAGAEGARGFHTGRGVVPGVRARRLGLYGRDACADGITLD